MLELKDDFGFTLVDNEEEQRIANSQEAERYAEKLDRMWSTIEPFLDNLARNPEKDIHWPDRDVKIAAFKQKLIDIVKS